MSKRLLVASILMACLLSLGCLGVAVAPNGATAGERSLKSGEGTRKSVRKSSRKKVVRSRRRTRAPRIPQPMGAASIYFDYPYYFSRGHYPTHIVQYVYYPTRFYSRRQYGRYGSRKRARRN